MLKKIIDFPWYIFFLPVFFILHTINGYFALISLHASFRYLGYYLLISLLLYLAQLLIFRNSIKAGVYTMILLILFFFWGSMHDFLKNTGLPSFFVSYKFLLSLVLIILVITFITLKRTHREGRKIHQFFQLSAAVILFMEAGITVYKIASHEERRNNPGYYNENPDLNMSSNEKPDIFYITLDEYTSTKALKKYFNFDNSYLDSILLKNNFFISHNSQGNYNSTPFSVSSTFHMQYFKQDLEGKDLTAKKMLEGCYSFKKNPLNKLFSQQGYKVLNFGIIDIDNNPVASEAYFRDYETKILTDETFWGRMKKEILWNLVVRLPGFNEDAVPEDNFSLNKQNFSLFFSELKKESKVPRFVIGHLMMPHRPFHFDRTGRQRMPSRHDYKDAVHDSLYIDQLIYTNTLIDSMALAVNKKHARPFVLVIAGDHGNRYSQQGLRSREKQFMDLNSYYFSDGDYSTLYDSISPVNSFRVILNKYFKTGLPLLKDSTIRFKD